MHKLKDYIVVVNNVIPEDICDLILAEYAGTEEWARTQVQDGVNTNIRDAHCIPISSQTTLALNLKKRAELDRFVFEGAAKALRAYTTAHPHCAVEVDSGYDLLRYKKGHFYKEHIDSFTELPRAVSCSFALNDDFSGGEFSFFGGTLDYKIPKGGALLFPSNFLYPHQVRPVLSGCRFSIVTWFI